ncbi:MAG: ComEC/Rec2 family competence protein, partial [Treponema sp.]|nr:ComEC/Rec2 family competence protein [Treponema sp.]
MKIKISIFAALGAILAYYCFCPLFRWGFAGIGFLMMAAFIPLVLLCLSNVLANWPFLREIKPQASRFFRIMPLNLGAFIIGLILGTAAGTAGTVHLKFGIPAETVQGISGVLLNDPSIISGGKAMSTLSLESAAGKNGVRASAAGEITVFFPEESTVRLREFGRGTGVFAEGSLQLGENPVFSARSLHITNTASSLDRFRTGLRLGLTQRFARPGQEGWGGLALALWLGIRDNLETGVAGLYREAGCSHVLALSGMHLAVLVALISFLLKKPMGIKPAALTGAVIIIAYCFIVGPLPSLIRAAIMYLLGVLAIIGMLKRDTLSILCMAFLIQIMFMPQAGYSLSFILSYLALAGILTIGTMINNIFKGKIPVFLLQPVSASLGAFIASAGVTAWFFAELRPVGIIA